MICGSFLTFHTNARQSEKQQQEKRSEWRRIIQLLIIWSNCSWMSQLRLWSCGGGRKKTTLIFTDKMFSDQMQFPPHQSTIRNIAAIRLSSKINKPKNNTAAPARWPGPASVTRRASFIKPSTNGFIHESFATAFAPDSENVCSLARCTFTRKETYEWRRVHSQVTLSRPNHLFISSCTERRKRGEGSVRICFSGDLKIPAVLENWARAVFTRCSVAV